MKLPDKKSKNIETKSKLCPCKKCGNPKKQESFPRGEMSLNPSILHGRDDFSWAFKLKRKQQHYPAFGEWVMHASLVLVCLTYKNVTVFSSPILKPGKTIHVIICEFSSGLMLNLNVGSPSTHSVFVSRHILNCTADVQNASLVQFYSALQIYHRNNAMVMQNNSLSALCFTSDRLIERHSKCLWRQTEDLLMIVGVKWKIKCSQLEEVNFYLQVLQVQFVNTSITFCKTFHPICRCVYPTYL